MPFIIKINLRHSTTGGTIRTLRRFNNLVYNKKFNSLASTFSFDFYFDPSRKEDAELICVSHLHEVRLYYTRNTDPNYEPTAAELELTGYMIMNNFRDNGKPQFVSCAGYAKPGVLMDCDIPPEMYPLEDEGLTLRQIIAKTIKPFNIGLEVSAGAKGANSSVLDKTPEDRLDEDLGKTASESSQNVASYLSELARDRNIVLSHNAKGQVFITTPNTKGAPIFNYDFANPDLGDVSKMPGIETEMNFNAQGMHTHITVKMQADDTEDSNGAETDPPLRNPLLPVGPGAIYRPRVVVISSGNQFTVDDAARYELGREIREGVTLNIRCGRIETIAGKLISPNNTLTIKNPRLFLYKTSTWFIQEVEIRSNANEDSCTMKCVLPFGYDYDFAKLKNVFVDAHSDFPL